MFRALRSLFGKSPRPGESPDAPEDVPRPAHDCYVIGDLHGRADLLELILELVDAHIGGTGSVDPRLVFVGNYGGYGPDSLATLRRIEELSTDFPTHVAALMGQQERMLLDFLADPALRGPRWMRNGGAAALQSFGIDALDPAAAPEAFRDAASRTRDVLGEGPIAWLDARPHSWNSGTLWVVHAGADPLRPMPEQSPRVLIWGHPEFTSGPRADGVWIAHGHAEVPRPRLADGRIALHTGAWHSGQLSACAFRPDGRYDFLQT